MVGEPYQQSPAAGSTIVRVVCNGSDITFTRNLLTSSISFEVLAAYSGNFIEVYLSDAGCCGSFGGAAVNSNWVVLPALIFPRAATVAQKCVLCPAGKFQGAYGATNMSTLSLLPAYPLALLCACSLSHTRVFSFSRARNVSHFSTLSLSNALPPSSPWERGSHGQREGAREKQAIRLDGRAFPHQVWMYIYIDVCKYVYTCTYI